MKLPVLEANAALPEAPGGSCSESARPLLRAPRGGERGRYWILTWGCQMNEHDSEKIAGLLERDGYGAAASEDEADVIVLNTCSVREKAASKVYAELGRLKPLKKKNPRMILGVAGCVAQQERAEFFRRAPHVDLVLGPQAIPNLPRHMDAIREKRRRITDTVQHRRFPDYDGSEIRRNSFPKAWITVMEGCDKFCTFCVIPFTRGREVHRSASTILREAERLVREGFREIELLGQNVNCWKDGDTDFAGLLLRLSRIPGLRRLRFITSHPAHLSDRIIDAIGEGAPVICPALHLPVQSGSDRVLEAMNRGYSRADFLDRVRRLRTTLPGIALSTDLIVGFPTETPEDFRETMDLVAEVEFDSFYSFAYSPRPLTPALRWEDPVPLEEKLRRLQILQARQAQVEAARLQAWVGRTTEVLVEGPSKKSPAMVTGRTPGNRVVNFPGTADLLGLLVPVRIVEAKAHSLRGETL